MESNPIATDADVRQPILSDRCHPVGRVARELPHREPARFLALESPQGEPMSTRLKVLNGTRSALAPRLCDTCQSGVVQRGAADSDEHIYCKFIRREVRTRVVECNVYSDRLAALVVGPTADRVGSGHRFPAAADRLRASQRMGEATRERGADPLAPLLAARKRSGPDSLGCAR